MPSPEYQYLRHLVSDLAAARRAQEQAAALVQAFRDTFEEAHAGELAHLAQCKAATEALDTRLREVVLTNFALTNDTKPVEGVEVIQKTTLSYDATEALRWAVDKGLAVSLDRSAFEKIAKSTHIDFVTVAQVPAVRLATSLPEIPTHV